MNIAYIKGTALLILGMLLVFFGLFSLNTQKVLSGEGGVTATECTVVSSTTIAIGHQSSVEIVASASRNAFVRISQPVYATNTVAIGLGNDASLTTSGIQLAPGSASTSPDSIMLGLNTDFPYTGSIEAKTSLGSTTIGVTVCRY